MDQAKDWDRATTTPQDIFDGLKPLVNAKDTVLYANEVMDRARM